jgi:hypothetical protein
MMEEAVRGSALTELEKECLQLGLLTGRRAHEQMKQLYPQVDEPSTAEYYTDVNNTGWGAASLEKDVGEMENIGEVKHVANQYKQLYEDMQRGEKRKWAEFKYDLAHLIKDEVGRRLLTSETATFDAMQDRCKRCFKKSKAAAFGKLSEAATQVFEQDRRFSDLQDNSNMQAIVEEYWQTQPSFDADRYGACSKLANAEERRAFEEAKRSHIAQLEKAHRDELSRGK